MGETRHEPTVNPANPPTSDREESSRAGGSTRRETTTTPSTPPREASKTTGSQKCEVLRESCKNPATLKVTFPSGSTTFCCAEHKQTVVDNYPDQELVFEEV